MKLYELAEVEWNPLSIFYIYNEDGKSLAKGTCRWVSGPPMKDYEILKIEVEHYALFITVKEPKEQEDNLYENLFNETIEQTAIRQASDIINEQRNKLENLKEENVRLKEHLKQLKLQIQYKEKALARAKSETQRIANRVNKDKRRLIRRKFENAASLAESKEVIKALIENSPDTFSGTNIEKQQSKMFKFQNAVNQARQFLEE